jgi:cation transport regulator
MPYKTDTELPAAVREYLPEHAQDIYRAAFNNAWEQYADPSKRRGKESREEASHRVAWAAVEKEYTKDASGIWRRK